MVTEPERLKQLVKALTRLEEVMALDKTIINRDAAIKRFEFSFDLAWKTIKDWLYNHRGVTCHSPKGCFKAAYSQSLIEYEETWNQMTDDRNDIVHLYKEKLADNLYDRLPEYLKLLQNLLINLKNSP